MVGSDCGSNGNTNFDANGAGVRRGDAESNARAIGYACRHCDPQRVMKDRLTGAAAAMARLGPGLAAASTIRTQAPNGHLQWDDAAAPGFPLREGHIRLDDVRVWTLAEKGVAYPIDH
jgi:hypothetical protein